jgi:hypothetical protein
MRRPSPIFVALVLALVAGGWVTWTGWGNPDIGVFVFEVLRGSACRYSSCAWNSGSSGSGREPDRGLQLWLGAMRWLRRLCGIIPGHDHPGRTAPARRALETRPTAAAAATLPRSRRRATHRARPRLHGRDPVYVSHLHPLGAAAGRRVRLRQRDDLLAPVRRMGPSGRVRTAPRGAAGRTRRGRRARLVPRQCRLLQPARHKGGTTPAQTRSTEPSGGPSSTWPVRVPGCRCRCW